MDQKKDCLLKKLIDSAIRQSSVKCAVNFCEGVSYWPFLLCIYNIYTHKHVINTYIYICAFTKSSVYNIYIYIHISMVCVFRSPCLFFRLFFRSPKQLPGKIFGSKCLEGLTVLPGPTGRTSAPRLGRTTHWRETTIALNWWSCHQGGV